MTDIIRMDLEDGGVLLVRALDSTVASQMLGESGPVPAGRDPLESLSERVLIAHRSLERALEPIAHASRAILKTLGTVGPDEVAVEFGVELTAEASAIMARMGGDCHLTVSLKWSRSDLRPTAADVG